MPKKLKKYITVDKDILQGTPVISGTRIPVARLFSLVRQGYNDEGLPPCSSFPNLNNLH